MGVTKGGSGGGEGGSSTPWRHGEAQHWHLSAELVSHQEIVPCVHAVNAAGAFGQLSCLRIAMHMYTGSAMPSSGSWEMEVGI